jgi:hypothetical protein
MTSTARLAALVLALALGAAGARAAGEQFPAGASVGLAPPAGMTASKGFSGFEHRSGASIVVFEMPAQAYPEIAAKFTPDGFAASGFKAAAPGEPWPVAGGEGRLMRGTQAAQGVTFDKWVVIARSGAVTAMVTAQVPRGIDGAPAAEAVEGALRTVAFRAEPPIADQIAALPYRVGDLAGFRPVRVLAGSALLLTDGPVDIDPQGRQPFVVVASSMGGRVAPEQRAGLARRALAAVTGLRDVETTSETSREEDGTTVVRHEATARHDRTGAPLLVAQTMRFTPAGYLRTLAQAPAGGSEAIARAGRVAATALPK